MITIDGSYGEGGGQILRIAAAFAAILGKELRITRIRSGRSIPGLRRQHITGLQLLADCCGGSVDGLEVGSQAIRFRSASASPHPSSIADKRTPVSDHESTTVTGDTKTAGSICLLLQAGLPFALVGRKPIRWLLHGGTNATNAPQYDYWQLVFLPMLKDQFKLPPDAIRASVVRRGFYPRGGGEVHVDTIPLRRSLPAIHLTERGEVVSVLIRSFHAGKCPRRVAERMATAAKDHLEKNIRVSDIQVEIKYEEPAVASGSGIIIVATTTTNCRLGGSAVGSPKKSPQDVGTEAAEELCAALSDGGCVDEYLQDQLIIYMALAKGSSEIITGSITRHTSTAIWTAERCCGAQFQVERIPESNGAHGSTTALLSSDDDNNDTGRIPGRHRIRCVGIGMEPSESVVGAGGISSNQ